MIKRFMNREDVLPMLPFLVLIVGPEDTVSDVLTALEHSHSAAGRDVFLKIRVPPP